jgi:type I restriction enzyme S subunit
MKDMKKEKMMNDMNIRQAQLPEGWEIKKLGEVCDLMTGGTPSRSKPEYFIEGSIKWLVSGDINKGEIFDCDGRITEEGMNSSNTKYLPINSVLIALNGQGKTRGTVAMLRTKATCNQSLVCIFPKKNIKLLPEFLFCNLHGRYEEIRKITGDGGNDRRGLNMPLIRSLKIPLPPIPEQQRIVAILDEAFRVIERSRNNARQNLQNAKEFFESYLQGVFENKGEGWEHSRLGDVCQINDGTHFSPKNTDEGEFMYITAKNIKPYSIDLTKISYISEKDHKEIYSRCSPKKGDVLYIKDGATAGIAALNSLDEEFSLLSSVALLKCSPKILNTFLVHYMNSSIGKKNFLGYLDGAAITRLTLIKIKNVCFSLPPIKTQQTIVQKLDALSAETKKLEAIYQQKMADLEELKKSLLQKAFSGELKT